MFQILPSAQPSQLSPFDAYFAVAPELTQPSRRGPGRMRIFFAFLLIALFGWSNACVASGSCSRNDPNEMKYLIFWDRIPATLLIL